MRALRWLLYVLPLSMVAAQGPLEPPSGSPAPTMKTLDQVEARKPIAGGTSEVVISESGSYYLTGNITVESGNAITIAADNVTLDLNGFALISTAEPASGNGIGFSGTRANLTISNGNIRGTGSVVSGVLNGGKFANGIMLNSITDRLYNVRVSNVSVQGAGSSGITITPFGESVVTDCSVSAVGSTGIFARMVRGSSVTNTGGDAIAATVVENCNGRTESGGDGISAETVSNSVGVGGSGNGIDCSGVASNSIGNSSTGIGLSADTATNCKGNSGSGTGLSATMASNCRGISNSGIGLYVSRHATHSEGVSTSGAYGLQALGVASFCTGTRSGGTAVKAANAIGCTTFGGIVDASLKSLGTP